MKAFKNYLRTYRRHAGLTQADVAYLLGTQSGGRISRYERFARSPALETALAFEVVLAVPVGELFAGVREEVEHEVKKRARRLRSRLQRRQDRGRKVKLLTSILQRPNGDTKCRSMR